MQDTDSTNQLRLRLASLLDVARSVQRVACVWGSNVPIAEDLGRCNTRPLQLS
jgi:hypothetical protein